MQQASFCKSKTEWWLISGRTLVSYTLARRHPVTAYRGRPERAEPLLNVVGNNRAFPARSRSNVFVPLSSVALKDAQAYLFFKYFLCWCHLCEPWIGLVFRSVLADRNVSGTRGRFKRRHEETEEASQCKAASVKK